MSEQEHADGGVGVPDEPTPGVDAVAGGHAGQPEPLPDDVVIRALQGDPDATGAVEEGWERAKSMEGDAPTG